MFHRETPGRQLRLEAIAHYTDLNTALLQVISRASHLSGDGDLARRLAAYASFLETKERAGIERAMLSNAFAQDRFGPGMYERTLGVVMAKETHASQFQALASTADREFAAKTVRGAAVDEVARMQTVAFERAATGGFGIEPGQWFRTMTEQIDLMKRVEDHLSDGLISQATRLRDRAPPWRHSSASALRRSAWASSRRTPSREGSPGPSRRCCPPPASWRTAI